MRNKFEKMLHTECWNEAQIYFPLGNQLKLDAIDFRTVNNMTVDSVTKSFEIDGERRIIELSASTYWKKIADQL